ELRRALLLLDAARLLAAMHSNDVVLAAPSGALFRALEQGRIALLLAIEGAEPVGNDLAMLDVFWRSGVRMASLTWNRRTMLADGVGEHDTGGRLTALGMEAGAEMERLGVVT